MSIKNHASAALLTHRERSSLAVAQPLPDTAFNVPLARNIQVRTQLDVTEEAHP